MHVVKRRKSAGSDSVASMPHAHEPLVDGRGPKVIEGLVIIFTSMSSPLWLLPLSI